MLQSLLLVGCGGFVGSCLRFLVGKIFASPAGGFPWGTFVANVVGCFIIGVLLAMAEHRQLLSPQMSLLLVTGFCGGFTTFSTFADDLYLMADGRHFGLFALYAVASLVVGLVMVYLGRLLVAEAQ